MADMAVVLQITELHVPWYRQAAAQLIDQNDFPLWRFSVDVNCKDPLAGQTLPVLFVTRLAIVHALFQQLLPYMTIPQWALESL